MIERDVWYSRIEPEFHARFPEKNLLIRNMGKQGNTPGFRPHASRESQWAFPGAEKFHPDKEMHLGIGFFSTPDQWLHHLKADTIVAFFGYNESFDGEEGLKNYAAELDAFVKHTLTKAYNGESAPRLVLVSPIAFEDLSAQQDLPDGTKENRNLRAYSDAMKEVAASHSLTFIDLFEPSQKAASVAQFTTNGFAPLETSYSKIGQWLVEGIYGSGNPSSGIDMNLLHSGVKEKDWLWNNDYNIVNGVHTHGRRYNPYGPQNYLTKFGRRGKWRHSMTSSFMKLHAVESRRLKSTNQRRTNYHPSNQLRRQRCQGQLGNLEYQKGEAAIKDLTLADGYKVELFAAESDFPDPAIPAKCLSITRAASGSR